MKSIIPIACLFCFATSQNSFSQEITPYSDYNLNTYYTPDIVRNQLNIGFSTDNRIGSRETIADSASTSYFSWDLTPDFYRVVDTRKKVSLLNVYFNSQGKFDNTDLLNNDLSHASDTENQFSANYTLRFYNNKKQFLHVKAAGNHSGNYEKNKIIENGINNQNDYSSNRYNLMPEIGIGKGRIESVGDARQAIYILDELNKKGKLAKKLSDEEIFEFAQTISKVKNKRFFDSRLRKIEEISVVDSFLVSNNFLSDKDAGYFTTLYDMWEYGSLNERNSGQMFLLTLLPGTNYEVANFKSPTMEYNSKIFNYFSTVRLIYALAKVSGLNWQHHLSASLDGQLEKLFYNTQNETNNTSTEYIAGKETLFANYSLSYYPNTRTSFSVSAGQITKLDHIFKKNENGIVSTDKNFIYTGISNINLAANYYFSPQLRLSGYAKLNYSKYYYSQNDSNYKYISGQIVASLIYSIF